jgi:penicillin-binding protein 1B
METERRTGQKRWKRPLALSAAVFFVVAVFLGVYLWHLCTVIDKRFSSRKWSVPSTIYSDSTILFPGQTVNRETFRDKLGRLAYRTVATEPRRAGEMRWQDTSLEIHLRDLDVPSKQRGGFSVRIDFEENRIAAIVRIDTGENLPLLEIEPEEIMLLFGPEREQRELVSIGQVPVCLKYAVIVAEDNRFYEHHGFDPRGIVRALYTNLRHGEIRQGGSTLTQQLVKNYFLTPERTLKRKVREFFMAVALELMYTKDEILEIYLNEIYLGQKGSIAVCGVGEASRFYFGKPVDRLSLAEAAVIAGLIKGPNRYSPYENAERCRERRNWVIGEIRRNGWISQEACDAAREAPLEPAGYAAYGKKAPYFIDYLLGQLPVYYAPGDLSSRGLSLFTTLDTQVQASAERALKEGLEQLEKNYPALRRTEEDAKLQGAVIVMQPRTGYILAMAGGRDYAASQFNRITQARRQPGSAFKPFVYLTGLDCFTPSSRLSNEPRSYEIDGMTWQPRNVHPVAEKGLTMRQALAASDNLATVDLAVRTGLLTVMNTAMAFRFSTPLKPWPSLALGAFEVIPLEMARAFCTFAAEGVEPNPLSMRALVDEKGNLLENRLLKIERVISPEKAYIMNSMLRSVVTEGTARSLRSMGISFPAAGKTGTTNDNRDAWFIGYTPDILALVWVGFDNGDPVYAEGSTAALPVWAALMRSIPQYLSGGWFRQPPGVVTRTICRESGLPAVPNGCPETMEEVFLLKNAPADSCPVHRDVRTDGIERGRGW